MEKKFAASLLKKVRDDYNTIAKEWDISRPEVRASRAIFLKKIPRNARVLDVGCGNGIVYEFLAQKSIAYTGVDVSKKLIAYARARARQTQGNSCAEFKIISGRTLPFADKSFSYVVCYAMLHHMPGKENRERMADEMFRVLKPGGRLCITVWNLFSDYARDAFRIEEQLKHPHQGFDERDVLVQWKATPKKNVERYIHAFTLIELRALVRGAGFKNVHIRYIDKQTGGKSTMKNGAEIVLTAMRYL